MLVPGFVKELHEADAALDQPAGQAGSCWRTTACPARRRTCRDVLRLAARCPSAPGRWPACGRPSRSELMRVAISGSPIASRRCWLSAADGIERVALQCAIDARAGSRDTAPDRRCCGTARPDRRSAETRCPNCCCRRWGPFCRVLKTTNAGQVLRFAAQAVGRPGADARPAELLVARVHQDLARGVIEGVGDHRFDDGDVVDDCRQVRQQLRELRAALAMLGELELRARAAWSSD